MDKIFVINLSRRPDKKTHMESELAKINCDYEFFQAIDGTDVEMLSHYKYNLADWFDPNSGKAMTLGEVGCALSHYLIWENIVSRVENGVLPETCKVMILEDDVIFTDNFSANLESYISNRPFDMVYVHRKLLGTDTPVSDHLCVPGKSYWACAYVLSYAGALKLISTDYINNLIPVDEFLPIMYGCPLPPYDAIYKSDDKLLCYAVVPSLASLTPNAFYESETFRTNPVITKPTSYEYLGVKYTLRIIHIGPKYGDSYERLLNYCKIYGLSFNETDSDTTILLVLITNSTSEFLPVASPQTILRKYFENNPNHVIYGEDTFGSAKVAMIGPYNKVINQLDNREFQYNPNIFSSVDPMISEDISFTLSKLNYNNTQPCILLAENINQRSNILINRIENYTGLSWNSYYGYSCPRQEHSSPKIYAYADVQTVDYPEDLLEYHLNPTYEGLVNHIEQFIESDCEYFWFVDSSSHITDKNILHELLSHNKNVIAPMLKKDNSAWTNFWGDIDADKFVGYYKKSSDYNSISQRITTGCWNVPYVTNCFLAKKESLKIILPRLYNKTNDIDMRICEELRLSDIFIYVNNLVDFGRIREKLTIFDVDNPEWEKEYLHSNYYNEQYNEICDGIYTFLLFSQRFCTEMIALADGYGRWSDGKHEDKRLGKNYHENVPTVDIQLFEINYKEAWQKIVFKYIAPIVSKLYNSYKTNGINISFIVKYDTIGQKSLKPHHDSSTYTVNVALNQGGVDYEGGGCRFIRQNYILKNQPPGGCCIHPGRLTAYHEGLAVTSGTRYILVSFVN